MVIMLQYGWKGPVAGARECNVLAMKTSLCSQPRVNHHSASVMLTGGVGEGVPCEGARGPGEDEASM